MSTMHSTQSVGKYKCKHLSKVTSRLCCEICGLTYGRMKGLRLHYALAHQKIDHCCSSCYSKFDDLDMYNRHMKEHWDKGKFRCFDCDTTKTTKWSLRNHVQIHLTKAFLKSLQCELCDKYFTPKEMSSHMNRHPNIEDSLRCDKCDFACKTLNALTAHMQLVHSHYQCNVCDYVGRTWKALDTHSFAQHERVYVECRECYLIFSTENLLERHVAAEHPTMSLKDLVRYKSSMKCSICGVFKKNMKMLRRHLSTHSEYRTKHGSSFIECKLCLVFCSSKRGFGRHALTAHPEACNKDTYRIKKEMKCSHCGKKSDCLATMNSHIRTHNVYLKKENSAGFIVCKICNFFYTNKNVAKSHLAQTHPEAMWQDIYCQREDLKCLICDLSLKTTQSLNMHVTNTHMPRVETENKSYIRCRSCKLYFNAKYLFQNHVTKFHSKSSPEELIEYVDELICCGVVRTNLSLANAHIRGKHLKQLRQCSECFLVFSNDSSLKRHVVLKHPTLSVKDLLKHKTSMKCNICGKMQKNLNNLKHHLTTHSEYRSKHNDGFIECKLCLLFCTNKRGFINHASKVHPDAYDKDAYNITKELKCSYCGKKLGRVATINKHIRMHKKRSKEEDSSSFIVCKICHFFYKHQDSAIAHLEKKHPEATWQDIYYERKELKCLICDVSLTNTQSINKHVIHAHSTSFW